MGKKEIRDAKTKAQDQTIRVMPDPKAEFSSIRRGEWEKTAHLAEEMRWRQLGITEESAKFSEKAMFTDMDKVLMARRTKALLNTRDEIMSLYDFGHVDWIFCNTCGGMFNNMQYQFRILFAAAVWILDSIADAGTDLSELYALLPQDKRLLDRIRDLPVKDCRFDHDLIRSVEYVLHFRNEAFAQMESDGFGSERVLFCKPAATRKIRSDVPSRQTYEKLIALIPQKKIEEAVQQYQTCHQAWIEYFFETIRPFCKENDEIAAWIQEWNKKQKSYRQEIEKLTKAANKEFEKKPAPTREDLLSLHNGIREKSSASLDYTATAPKQHIDAMNDLLEKHPNTLRTVDKLKEVLADNDELNQKVDRAEELKSKRDSAANCCRSMLLYRIFLHEMNKTACSEFTCPQLPITDCYGICFALLYLIEQGSDLPWLYGPSTAITEQAVMMLPWACPVDVKKQYFQLKLPDHTDQAEQEEFVAVPGWNERKYSPEGEEDDPDFRMNLAQIFMKLSNCLVPRNQHVTRSMMDTLQRYGLRDDVLNIVLYAVSGIETYEKRIPASNFDEEYIQALSQKKGDKQRLSRAELEEQSAEQATEIRQLREALRKAEKQSEKYEKMLAETQQKTENERQELHDLREYVFHLNTGDDEKPDTDAVISGKLPYTVQQDTVIVGGQDSFLKAIRPLLKGKVRYIDREQNFDTRMLRSADVIWIQLKAISHSQYYKVTGAARKYCKRIRLFRQASASKCAEQVAENEK